MKIKLLKYFIRSIILLSSFTFCLSPLLFGQPQLENIEKTEISGGAEFNIMFQEAIRNGNVDMFRYFGQPTPPPPYSPEAITTFLGFDFDDNATYNGSYFIPPDPSGAAGSDRVIAVVNCMIECRTKTGTLLWIDDLKGFFTSLTPSTATFDPKVIYDQYEGRFVVVTLERVSSGSNPDPGNISKIFVAVSKTGSPATGTTADWYYHSIDAKTLITGSEHWADYPGFAIDEDAVYITNNMFLFPPSSGFGGVRLWIVHKGLVGGFYGGGTATVTIHNPYSGSGIATTTQPAHIFGTGGAGTGIGTYLVSYSGISDGTDEYVQIVRINSPLSSPTFTQSFINIGNIEGPSFPTLPDAPQSGSGTDIEVNDRRALHAVWRNNVLWLTTTIYPNSGPDASQTTAHWFKLATTSGGVVSYSDQGNIGGETIATGCYTFFPSIAVNSSNDVCIGFSASASTIYPGCYYTGRLSTDAAGFTITPDVVKAGLDYYVRTFGSGRNRWGDYSGASVDPSDDQTFYVFNEYALTRGTPISGEDGRWGTAFGVVPVSALPVELSSFIAKSLKDGVHLDWVTETEVNNYGFEVERKESHRQMTGDNWEKITFLEGFGNSNSPKDYSFIDREINYGSYAYRLKQIDNDGTFEYSDIIEVNAGIIPEGFVLEQNYPNPFNPSTVIKFALAESQQATLTVYDILGNEITQLFNETAEAGKVYEIDFDASDLSSGVYYYRISTPQKSLVRKMLLLQ